MTAAAALCAVLLQPVAAGAATQLVASPSSLSFSGTVGGANPARQNVNLTSSDGTAAGFGLAATQAWLVIATSSSSTTPSTVGLGINLSGLAAGTYTGTVTISSKSQTVVGTSVSVTLTVAAANPELIKNGGFEVSASPWVLSGDAQQSTVTPLDGSGDLRIQGTGTAYQQIAIPNTAQAAEVEFFTAINTFEKSTTTAYDTLKVEVRDKAGGLLATPATYSNLDPFRNVGEYVRRYGFSLLAYKGQTVRLQFSAYNSPTLGTDFFIDDVSVSTKYTPPALSLYPASLSFTASAFRGNSQPQYLRVANMGTGSVSWSATANQPWLSVTPSGTTPQDADITVNTSSLAAGNYSGTVTVSAAGASNSPQTMSVALTVVPPQFISAGTFPNDGGWVRSGNSYWGLWESTQGGPPSGAGGYSYLGNNNVANGLLYQTVTIPSAATTANLSFYLRVDTNETSTAGPYDKLYVEVTDTGGKVLATLATYSNVDRAFGFWRKGNFNMIAYKGQPVRLQFRATTDGTNTTTFSIDDVSVQ